MTNAFQVVTAVGVAVVGYNMFEDESWKNVNYNRWISSFAIVGSTNPQDFAVELRVGQRLVGTFYNSTGGANIIPDDTDRKFVKAFVPRGQEIQCIVIDAAAGNSVVAEIKFDSANKKVYSYRRPYYRAGGAGESGRWGTRKAWGLYRPAYNYNR